MCSKKIEELRDLLNNAITQDDVSSDELLEISRELDSYIIKFLKEKSNNSSKQCYMRI